MALLKLPQATRELLGIELTAEQQAAFERYAQALIEWNERVNLTAITDPLAIEMRHFLDSLTICKVVALTPGLRVIDVGSGAGFPGIPLKIVAPGIALTLLEATGKKTAYLEDVLRLLKLTQYSRVVNARAEDSGQDPQHRERYDLVLARAVAHMPILMEYLLPLCRIGGRCVAMKGESAAEEISAAEHAIRLLGGRFTQIAPIELPHVAETHYLVVVEKVAATPPQYPRKPGLPSKKPL
jgi:16S rRNA (guanine527-N7)-methyltransferase